MSNKKWAQVLDKLYEMGGSGEYPSEKTEGEIESDVDLSQQLDLSEKQVREGVKTLLDRRLATDETIGLGKGKTIRNNVTLKSDGFQLAHDRDQAQRDRASNRAVTLLTLVLAFVGIAQATALTAQVSQIVRGTVSFVVWLGAFLILIVTYVGLYRSGALDFSN
ncbi:uncharacterized protein HfgLR_03025 [Haloferax gibbonsii]|uniref:Uncharacterized protein n=1 Tax=Haloferax gibbonsii TaxID=35746 RepID=A0A871BCL4_HALGI|nr:hypothetical protein [Haloferax gibbonsii]QOS10752.1 uncharacterized protein HfgLR_03025 [Haloferax gibbonsii]